MIWVIVTAVGLIIFEVWAWRSRAICRVDYAKINRLEHELFPEWFQTEWPNGLPAFIDNSPGAIIPLPAGADVHWLDREVYVATAGHEGMSQDLARKLGAIPVER